jgi:hypothetical protein
MVCIVHLAGCNCEGHGHGSVTVTVDVSTRCPGPGPGPRGENLSPVNPGAGYRYYMMPVWYGRRLIRRGLWEVDNGRDSAGCPATVGPGATYSTECRALNAEHVRRTPADPGQQVTAHDMNGTSIPQSCQKWLHHGYRWKARDYST